MNRLALILELADKVTEMNPDQRHQVLVQAFRRIPDMDLVTLELEIEKIKEEVRP